MDFASQANAHHTQGPGRLSTKGSGLANSIPSSFPAFRNANNSATQPIFNIVQPAHTKNRLVFRFFTFLLTFARQAKLGCLWAHCRTRHISNSPFNLKGSFAASVFFFLSGCFAWLFFFSVFFYTTPASAFSFPMEGMGHIGGDGEGEEGFSRYGRGRSCIG